MEKNFYEANRDTALFLQRGAYFFSGELSYNVKNTVLAKTLSAPCNEERRRHIYSMCTNREGVGRRIDSCSSPFASSSADDEATVISRRRRRRRVGARRDTCDIFFLLSSFFCVSECVVLDPPLYFFAAPFLSDSVSCGFYDLTTTQENLLLS